MTLLAQTLKKLLCDAKRAINIEPPLSIARIQ